MRYFVPAAVIAIGAGALLLTACSGGGGGPAPAPTTSAPKAAVTTGAAPTGASPAPAAKTAPLASPSPATKTAPAALSPSPASKVGAVASPASAAVGALQVRDNATLGKYLTDGSGRTLYKFARDTADTSNCNDACAQTWPPAVPPASGTATAGAGVTGKLASFPRADGRKQISYDGVPLYYFASDTQPGDTKGQGVGGNWTVVSP